jgi:peptide/nickel transport system permease protein
VAAFTQVDTSGVDAGGAGPVGPPGASAGEPARRRQSSGRARYFGGKVAASIGSLAFVTVGNFFLFRVIQKDPVGAMTRNTHISAAARQALRHRLGYDQPLLQQFFTYLNRTFLHGDLGISLRYSQPVSSVIADRIWPTILLVGTSTLLATVLGIWLGINSGWKRDGVFDRTATGSTLTLYAMPEFWFGMILILVFATGFGPIPGIFPTSGLVDTDVSMTSLQGVLNVAYHLVLPVTTLTLSYLAEYSLVMRSSLIDEMGSDYLQTARAKGLRDLEVRNRHAVPNALLPSVTVIVLNLGFVISGAITIETVFSIPGLGLLTYTAIQTPDPPLLQGLFLLFSASVILANLVTDLMYVWLDPRVRAA